MEPTACSSFPFHQPTCTPAGQDPSEKWDINEEPNGDNGDEDDYVDEGEGDEDEEDSKDDKPNMDLSGTARYQILTAPKELLEQKKKNFWNKKRELLEPSDKVQQDEDLNGTLPCPDKWRGCRTQTQFRRGG